MYAQASNPEPCQFQQNDQVGLYRYYCPQNEGYAAQFENHSPNISNQAYYCDPQKESQTQPTVTVCYNNTSKDQTTRVAARLPAISNLMKEQVKEEYSDYYQPNPTMTDYRVEKVSNSIVDPYIHLEQPTYADFTNAHVLNHQDMINQMNNFPLSANYMSNTQVQHQPAMSFNLFDLNLSNFSSFNQTCEPSLPLMHQSPSQQSYGMTPHTNFTPPPQDPLAADQKPIKKRMAAVQCHQNSVCSNCKTRETTLWRRNGEGGVECNACNLYFRKNHRKRPLSLRKDGIMKRNRRPRNESPNHK